MVDNFENNNNMQITSNSFATHRNASAVDDDDRRACSLQSSAFDEYSLVVDRNQRQ